MIVTKIQDLLKSKYNGSKVMMKRDSLCDNNKLTLFIQISEEYNNQSDIDTIQKEIRKVAKVEFNKITPPIEVI